MARTRNSPRPSRRVAAVESFEPAHPADRAIVSRDPSSVATTDRPAFDAVLAAFEHYEGGRDDAAREALQAIGLGSPFTEWKLLLRGLIAYTAGDDERARENLGRLDASRLPARLAAPVRVEVDPAYRQAAPDAVRRQAEELTDSPLAAGLRQLRTELNRGRSLRTAFRKLDALLPMIRDQAPELLPRLATCFYQTIQTNGEPSDLDRYRQVFGPPPDDPDFDRLQALINEEREDLAQAAHHWSRYERWLERARLPIGEALLRRVRAHILHRLGRQADRLDREGDEVPAELRDFLMMLSGQARSAPKPVKKPIEYWRRATELAPDWEEPARELLQALVDKGKNEEAEAVARRLLAHTPQSLRVKDDLAALLTLQGRADEVHRLRMELLAAHPLDRVNRILAAGSYLSMARKHLRAREFEAAAAVLDEGDRLCREELPGPALALRAVVTRARKETTEADRFEAEARAVPGQGLVVAYVLAIDSALAGLRPAQRKLAADGLATALAGTAPPHEVQILYATWDQYRLEGITYRGQKTHEKKIHELILRSPRASAPEREYEELVRVCQMRKLHKIVLAVCEALHRKFPANPMFPYAIVASELDRGGRWTARAMMMIETANRLAQQSAEPRHHELLDQIEDYRRELHGCWPMLR